MPTNAMRRRLNELERRSEKATRQVMGPDRASEPPLAAAPLQLLLHARDLVEAGKPIAQWAPGVGVTEGEVRAFQSMLPRRARPGRWVHRFHAAPPGVRTQILRSFNAMRRHINRLEQGDRLDALARFVDSMAPSMTDTAHVRAPAIHDLAFALNGSGAIVHPAPGTPGPKTPASPPTAGLDPAPDIARWWPELAMLATVQARLKHPSTWWPTIQAVRAHPLSSAAVIGPAAQANVGRSSASAGARSRARRSDGSRFPTFLQHYEDWHAELAATRSPAYASSVAEVFNYHFLPVFGHMSIAAITTDDLNRLRDRLAARRGRGGGLVSDETVKHVMQHLLRCLVSAAQRYGFDPPKADVKPRATAAQPLPQPFTSEERTLILRGAPAEHLPYLRARFATGMTTSEIHALQWGDVDLIGRQIRVTRVLARGKPVPCPPTSCRTIRISAGITAMLEDRLRRRRPDTELVFHTPNGAPLREGNLNARVWAPLLKRLHLPHRPLRSIRATHVALRLASGHPPELVAVECGYTDTYTFYRRFKDLIPPDSPSHPIRSGSH